MLPSVPILLYSLFKQIQHVLFFVCIEDNFVAAKRKILTLVPTISTHRQAWRVLP
jgi:hypothetical protein